MTFMSYGSVCATASNAGQNGASFMGATASGGTPTPVTMKYSTASPRRPVDASSVSRSMESSGNGGREASTMNGGSYSASFVMPRVCAAASSARAPPEE